MSTNNAVADFLEDVGKALIRLAEEVRPLDADVRIDQNGRTSLEELELGTRQRQIVEALAEAGEAGMRAADVAKEIVGDPANTHTSLTNLGTRGVVEKVGDTALWRLRAHYRGVSDPYLRMAGHVRAGEWSTYGDVSIAVRGDSKAARAVGRAAATLDAFPNPHRILWSGGRIPPTWRTSQASEPTPEVCRERLLAEHVPFDPVKRTASRSHYVSWDVLVERDAQEG